MFLTEFNSTTMQRQPALVFSKSIEAPVIINRQSHESVVMLSKSKYAEIMAENDKMKAALSNLKPVKAASWERK